ncbi:putative BOI-related E3 ubiquitin-protein ligase 3 [Sesamum alatum]|uniref:BOI-related E3 ubiquitin-protein ligase 3 n=1 Tax=Sesamum alatum TaxID=300844 RepID=A0AAE1YWC8_9LAMI|nr:putative BOI-related E3 ubiquitin-protein ligase 3 [Sesamum alatum]
MLGGGGSNGNTIFPGFVEENRVSYDNNSLPQLQLFGHVPIGATVGTVNCMGNGQAPTDNRPINRVGEGETLSMQQKLHISLNNNFCQDEAGHIGTVLNPNPVSTGLKLSCEEEERNSSVTSACENMKNNLPAVLSLGNTIKMEIDRQTEEFGRYIKLQEENILKGVREINQRHTISLLNALEKGVNRKLHEKELEIESMNRKNKELGDWIKQVAMEAQSWHYRAKYNESVVNVLKSNIQQLLAQGTAQAREGSGDSEVDDAVSCSNHQRIVSGSGNQGLQNHPPKCRVCNGKEVSVLILPCRHLCLCIDCEGFIDVCPMCQVMKTASVQVYM